MSPWVNVTCESRGIQIDQSISLGYGVGVVQKSEIYAGESGAEDGSPMVYELFSAVAQVQRTTFVGCRQDDDQDAEHLLAAQDTNAKLENGKPTPRRDLLTFCGWPVETASQRR